MKRERKQLNGKIYKLNKGVIEVYQFEPLMYRLNLLRAEELKRIPVAEQTVRREPTRTFFKPKKGIVFECDNYTLREFDLFKLDEQEKARLLRKAYINGVYRHDPVSILDDKIFLSPYDGLSDYRIQLTEDAYLGYLLENERFDDDMLDDRSLDRQRGSFKISDEPIVKLPTQEVEAMFQSDLITGSYDDTLGFVEKSSKVLEKIR